MVNERIENIYLINAPAGSGKTTKIKSMLINHITSNPDDNILCITYTNRAADELKEGIESNKIFFGTIHSFINTFINPFFSHNYVLDLFWEIYEDQIVRRIKNEDNEPHINESNQKYLDKYGSLNIDTLKSNIKKISYNETSFNSLYYGGLSHDDLIIFTKKVSDKYPIIKNKISKKYQVIFIDEYQDTTSEVLQLFFSSVVNSHTKMYLLGDKMQQIYSNYDGSFENEFKLFNKDIALTVNHRSIPVIIEILNNLYNDSEMIQGVYEKNRDIKPDFKPRIILCKSFDSILEENKKKYPNTLILYLFNQNKFNEIGVGNLYNSFNRMEKYSFSRKYKATDVLSDTSSENPDPVMRFLFLLHQAYCYFKTEQYGNLISLCKNNKNFFDIKTCTLVAHSDKIRLKNIWNEVFKIYDNDTATIQEILDSLNDKKVIRGDFISGIYESLEYEDTLTVEIKEIKLLAQYLNDPHISTQHGVKGESHDTVIFVADDSRNTPLVYMYNFFEIWSKIDFSLKEFEGFYYEYLKFILSVEKELGMKINDLNANSHNKNEKNKKLLMEKSEEILSKFNESDLFNYLCKNIYVEYLNKPIVGNVKKCFKNSTVYGVLSAYRLFYVGCSRARRNLTILVNESKINPFRDEFTKKAIETGFKIE